MTARASRLAEIPSQTYVAIADFPIQQMVLHPKTKEQVLTYTKENSPLRVGQQLAYSFDQTLTNPHLVDHSFWVDKIQVVGINKLTKLYGSLGKGRPNALYAVEKRFAPGQSVILGVVIAAGTIGVTLYLLGNFSSGFGGWTICC